MSAAHEEEWALDTGAAENQPDPNLPADDGAAIEAPELNEIEKLASELGWKPESQWKGPKEGWTPADQYLRTTHAKQQAAAERAREATRHLRASQRSYDELQQRMERLTRTTSQLAQEQEARHRAEIERYFESEKRKAAKDGNDELYEELDAQKHQAQAALDEKFRQEPEINYTQQAQEMLADPIVGKFLKEHPWVVQDEEAYSYAFSIAQDYADAGYPKSMQIQAVKAALREEYPDYFKGRAQSQARPAPQVAPQDDELEDAPWEMESERQPRAAQPQDPVTGKFVKKDEAFEQPVQQQRRPAANVQSGSRMPSSSRMASPEAQAWNALPPEARAVYQEQKKNGSFKGDIVRFAKIYNGDTGNVLD
jgi:signal recognition particle subunit SEC65